MRPEVTQSHLIKSQGTFARSLMMIMGMYVQVGVGVGVQFRGFFSNFFAISTWDEEGIPECFRKLRNAAECCGMLQNASLEISKVAKHVVTCAPLDPY